MRCRRRHRNFASILHRQGTMRKLHHDEILERRLSHSDALAAERNPVIGILENVRSLYNVGSCFRTADAMLLHSLVLCGYTPTPPRREIDKTALGATTSVPWAFEQDTVAAIRRLQSEGWRVYALEITNGGTPLDRVSFPVEHVAFVVGNELAGVGAEALDACDGAIDIPMFGVKHSLNVAVAFGITAWELVRRMRSPG